MVKNLPANAGDDGLDPWCRKIQHAKRQLNPGAVTTTAREL